VLAAEVPESPFIATLAAHAAALAASAASRLEAAGAAFEGFGASLLAAEAFLAAAAAYRLAGGARAASAMTRRASELAAVCGDVRTPGLSLTTSLGTANERLTRREREVAAMAAAGASSREIAERLVLSVRTVDNHLQNVYGKLGVTRRDELARVLSNQDAEI
jgi:DNA-binding CsgD family transcriptional regulator